ncbi:MAG: glycosyltransferase family 4 protein [Deltaproteobacteria bacterium]|nr:glycosyltransferase family 4 protein [Deltaproteobacteria bacterium]
MRVLVFTALYPNNIWPQHGVFVKERVVNSAAFERCEIKVVAPVPYFPAIKINQRWRYSQVARQEIRDGLEVYHPRYFMIPKVGMALHGWLMFLSLLPALRGIRKSFDFDIIDAHYLYPDSFVAVLMGRYFKKPVVVSARGSDINQFKDFPLIRRLLRYTLCRAQGVIAVSAALKQAITQLGFPEERIRVIPNGVDLKKFYPTPKSEARGTLGFARGRVILSVGHLAPVKGFDLLIKAVKILVDDLNEKDLTLIIAGGGAYRKELERLVSSLGLGDNVLFPGEIAHQDLRLWYSAADVFCLASLREGWPNVLLESLACGTPVVATAVGGVPEIVCSSEVGLLAERNERKIAEKISQALRQSWDSDSLVRHAQQHTWHRAAASVHNLFAAILNGSGSAAYNQKAHSPTPVRTGSHG